MLSSRTAAPVWDGKDRKSCCPALPRGQLKPAFQSYLLQGLSLGSHSMGSEGSPEPTVNSYSRLGAMWLCTFLCLSFHTCSVGGNNTRVNIHRAFRTVPVLWRIDTTKSISSYSWTGQAGSPKCGLYPQPPNGPEVRRPSSGHAIGWMVTHRGRGQRTLLLYSLLFPSPSPAPAGR